VGGGFWKRKRSAKASNHKTSDSAAQGQLQHHDEEDEIFLTMLVSAIKEGIKLIRRIN
jgi:anti-sigma28 factor (negative regulator of flagellin synthesis)